MTESEQLAGDDRIVEQDSATPQRRNWDSVTALIAAMIGVLALLVSGYTAYIQRQQVRAEVWPSLLIGFYEPELAVGVHNKGVGPAIVGSIQVWVDGQPARGWTQVLQALGLPAEGIGVSTLSNTVISPGERVLAIRMADPASYQAFRDKLVSRLNTEVCYCSTLGECWLYSDRTATRKPRLSAIGQCPVVPDGQAFED
ncbi:MAG TPA: hypothetical protein PKC03_09110 [Dokdonella sp.]|nr:hypothetical protein [Dokdonella sp.]